MGDSNLIQNEGWQNVLKLILPYFFIVGILQLIAYYYLGLDLNNYENIHKTSLQSLIIAFSTFIGTITVIWLMQKFIDKQNFSDLGFKNVEPLNDSGKGILLGFIIMFLGFMFLYFGKQIEIKNINFNFYSFLSSIFLFLFVAISEELLVRGYILKNLMVSFNNCIALIVSSVIFSLMHSGNPNIEIFSLFQLFISGLLLGIPYIITKNLWFSIGLHFSWNFFQGTIFGFNVSGFEHYSIIQTKYNTANMWNGGFFGFEGSILCLIFQIVVIALILIKFNKADKQLKLISK
jgi:membrane protease YdiL (CAAX protease family)